MSLIAFINKKTYEIKDELEDYFYCDYEIRNVIALLNKKGYKTNFSCAGHNEVGLMWPTHKLPISELEEYLNSSKNDNTLNFIKNDNEYFYHKDEKVYTAIYISFNNKYEFEILPKDFKYEIFNEKSYISKIINFYKDDKHSIRKADREIYGELEDAHKELEEWAIKLKFIDNKEL